MSESEQKKKEIKNGDLKEKDEKWKIRHLVRPAITL